MNARAPDVVTVAVTRADGGLTILRVITAEYEPDGAGGRRKRVQYDATPGYIDGIINKHDWRGPLAPVSWRLVPNDFVAEGADRTFRDAWKDGGGGRPGVDMPKAREIQRGRLREARAPLLEALDAEYLRADEAGDQQRKKQVAARKQALRDVTADPRIEAARSPEDLNAVLAEMLIG